MAYCWWGGGKNRCPWDLHLSPLHRLSPNSTQQPVGRARKALSMTLRRPFHPLSLALWEDVPLTSKGCLITWTGQSFHHIPHVLSHDRHLQKYQLVYIH